MQFHEAPPFIPQTPRAAASRSMANANTYDSDVLCQLQPGIFTIQSRIQELTKQVCAACRRLNVESGVVVLHPAAICTCPPLPALLVRVWPLATKTHTVHALLQQWMANDMA